MGRKILMLVIVAMVALTLVGCSKADNSEPVAIVNDTVITQIQLEERVKQAAAMNGFDLSDPQLGPYLDIFNLQVLEGLIEEVLLKQETEKRNIKVTKEELNVELTNLRNQFNSEAEYKDYFNNYLKMSDKEIEEILNMQLLFHSLYEEVTKEITTTDVDLEAYYNDNQTEFYLQEQVQARHILVKTEEEALEIIKEIVENGQDMAELAALKSIDPSAKVNGGDLGFFGRNEMVEAFENAAFGLAKGEITLEPVQTAYGYHIIRVEDKEEGRQRSFAEVKEELEERFIYEAKNMFFHDYMVELRENANIVNKLEENFNQSLEDEEEKEEEKK